MDLVVGFNVFTKQKYVDKKYWKIHRKSMMIDYINSNLNVGLRLNIVLKVLLVVE